MSRTPRPPATSERTIKFPSDPQLRDLILFYEYFWRDLILFYEYFFYEHSHRGQRCRVRIRRHWLTGLLAPLIRLVAIANADTLRASEGHGALRIQGRGVTIVSKGAV